MAIHKALGYCKCSDPGAGRPGGDSGAAAPLPVRVHAERQWASIRRVRASAYTQACYGEHWNCILLRAAHVLKMR